MRILAPFLALAALAAAATSQTTIYVNPVFGSDVCFDGSSPVYPGPICPSPPAPGPFQTISQAVLAAASPPMGTPVTILVASALTDDTADPVVFDTALGETFPIVVPPATVIRYDAANSVPGVLVRVVAPSTAASVFDFTATPGVPYPSSGGLDGSTLGQSIQAIWVEGGQTGVTINSIGNFLLPPTEGNFVTIQNIRFWRSENRGVSVSAAFGNCPATTSRAEPTIAGCLFTHDDVGTATPELDEHLLVQSVECARSNPLVVGNLFKVEAMPTGLRPRVSYAIRLVTIPGSPNPGPEPAETFGNYVLNTVDGFSNVGSGTPEGIDVGFFVDTPTGTSGSARPTVTSCEFKNCGLAGMAAYAVNAGIDMTVSSTNFIANGKRFASSSLPNVLSGHGVSLNVVTPSLRANFQYCGFFSNHQSGLFAISDRQLAYSSLPVPVVDLRLNRCTSAFNLAHGFHLKADGGQFAALPPNPGSGNLLLNSIAHHNLIDGVRLESNETEFFGTPMGSLTTRVSNLLSYRNNYGVRVRTQNSQPGALAPKLNYVTAARNVQEGLLGDYLAVPGIAPEIENATLWENWNGQAGGPGMNDVAGLTATAVRFANLASADPSFPQGCTWPTGFGTGLNLRCFPQFVDSSSDNYHLVADEATSRGSLDTGKDNPVGFVPGTDLDQLRRIVDFLNNGPNGNFPGVADRSCFEVQ